MGRRSRWETAAYFRYHALEWRRQGIRSGFDMGTMGRLHSSEMFVDTELAGRALGIPHGDLDQAVRDTAR